MSTSRVSQSFQFHNNSRLILRSLALHSLPKLGPLPSMHTASGGASSASNSCSLKQFRQNSLSLPPPSGQQLSGLCFCVRAPPEQWTLRSSRIRLPPPESRTPQANKTPPPPPTAGSLGGARNKSPKLCNFARGPLKFAVYPRRDPCYWRRRPRPEEEGSWRLNGI